MKLQDKKGDKNKTGAYGEAIAAKFYIKKGFSLLEQNYLKKWGEIDLVLKNNDGIRFVEVKTVSYETKNNLEQAIQSKLHRPEENVHFHKLNRLGRTIETWLLEHNWEGGWQLDVAAVRIVPREKYATVKLIENVVIEG